ncbi:MAG: hypothetical protein ETSY2_05095 [Candidatus Entotheonella gemina]|uniref:Iminophenyl-pyruvate dimer synthase domain-containing protein n=1 Tax=Candidatus Entotheonella gemina TaxID=1429439 RepID=W4MDS3_9BACT|nr:MAG: hypothetical protein ETSY2_05095 [Candidatus Entotheonella gemina]
MSTVSPIKSKAELIYCLQEIAQLEHAFMCQYLYAAFSLKKHPDETCSATQFEFVRRWASVTYMIARQEMEHLSIANSLLTAIGGQPIYTHQNFPTLLPWYTSEVLATGQSGTERHPCALPFVLEPFSLNTVRRFACMESPKLQDVPESYRHRVETWCFENESKDCPCVTPAARDISPCQPRYELALPPQTVEIGTVQELYMAVREGFQNLEKQLGADVLFNGHPSGQSEIPSEYNLSLFRIDDLPTALTGIDLVTKQGEGINAPPGYESHFLHWCDMAQEYASMLEENADFQPAKALPANPTPRTYDSDPMLKAIADVFNHGYITLLYMLTGYYTNYRPKSWNTWPFLSAALEQTAFSPMMTMLIRPLAELLTNLPWDNGFAGPTFDIDETARPLLNQPDDARYQDLSFYQKQLDPIISGLEAILQQDLPPDLVPKVELIRQNMGRVKGNLDYVCNQGIFPNFNPSNNFSCPVSQG